MGDFTGIHHLAFVTADMEKTVRFWRDLLGMRLIYGYGGDDYRQYFFEVSAGNMISFFAWPGAEGIPYRRHGQPEPGARVFDHISIGVADEERLWELADRLVAADFPASDVVDHGCFRSLYSYDPNGIPIEFSVPVAGVDLGRHPVMRDLEPVPAALEGSDPVAGRWPEIEPLPLDERIVVEGEGSDYFRERPEPFTP